MAQSCLTIDFSLKALNMLPLVIFSSRHLTKQILHTTSLLASLALIKLIELCQWWDCCTLNGSTLPVYFDLQCPLPFFANVLAFDFQFSKHNCFRPFHATSCPLSDYLRESLPPWLFLKSGMHLGRVWKTACEALPVPTITSACCKATVVHYLEMPFSSSRHFKGHMKLPEVALTNQAKSQSFPVQGHSSLTNWNS